MQRKDVGCFFVQCGKQTKDQPCEMCIHQYANFVDADPLRVATAVMRLAGG